MQRVEETQLGSLYSLTLPINSLSLPTQTETLDQLLISVRLAPPQVRQHSPPLPDQLEQPSARSLIVLVYLQVLYKLVDALGHHGDL
jgi:hypothetical protein